MQLYFLRHGIAEDWRPGIPDAARRLTDKGIAKMRLEAKGMARLELSWDIIYSSPYPRALETAQIVQRALSLPPVRVEERLSAGSFRLGVLQEIVEGVRDTTKLLFVGHNPDLSLLVQCLTGANVELKKGSLALVETSYLEPNLGVLEWLLTPTLLSMMGRGTGYRSPGSD